MFGVRLISPSHREVGGSEHTTRAVWACVSPPSSRFTVGHFIFLFFRSVLSVVVSPCFVFFDLPPPSPPHLR